MRKRRMCLEHLEGQEERCGIFQKDWCHCEENLSSFFSLVVFFE